MAIAGCFVEGFLHNKAVFVTPKAGCYKGDHLMKAISVQIDWGIIIMWTLW